jgi:16S rRNA (cytosine1402-N4)-methyltransferase
MEMNGEEAIALSTPSHRPVMCEEIKSLFSYVRDLENPKIFDCTFGLGGHSSLLLQSFENLKIVAFEIDELLCKNTETQEVLSNFGDRIELVNESYTKLRRYIRREETHGILMDLGVASPQIDNSERGFSYQEDVQLDMRMSRRGRKLTAMQLLNELSEKALKALIYRNSQDRFAPLIAREIVKLREREPIRRSGQLVKLLEGQFKGAKHRSLKHIKCLFQALRIEVNREFENLEKFIIEVEKDKFIKYGKFVIITYHSIENRLTRKLLSRSKCIRASKSEIKENSRARSARIIYKEVP